MQKTIFVLNGPNLNLLGHREPELYGYDTLEDVKTLCEKAANGKFQIRLEQSNYEGQIIDWIHEARQDAHAIVINPAALTHSSIGILDALKTFEGPVIEVHLTNIHKRESFRHHSYVSLRADAVIAGLGVKGYEAAITFLCDAP